jgi:CDP-paratose 2-epimerase
MRIVVTGGAGFVGSHLACGFKRDHEGAEVIAVDNLRRRGSELALPRLSQAGVRFLHGDIRNREDLNELPRFDVIIECSAEPSARAGYESGTDYLFNTNLVGTHTCLEAARRNDAMFVFLSTSRIYPIKPLRDLPLSDGETRLALPTGQSGPGWSQFGISEQFDLNGARTMYGATKLASELLIQEYGEMYGLRAITNRCGVITGPWQMGKVDQGFFVHWAAKHFFQQPLAYVGFGGAGHQVRDVLHVADLYELVSTQIAASQDHTGCTYNVGGGPQCSVSLAELTNLCADRVHRKAPPVGSQPQTHPSDVPFYVSDIRKICARTKWQPRHTIEDILDDVFRWLGQHRSQLEFLFT